VPVRANVSRQMASETKWWVWRVVDMEVMNDFATAEGSVSGGMWSVGRETG